MELQDTYKDTKIGRIPNDWDNVRLNSIIQEDRKITYGIVQPGSFDKNGRFLVRGKDYSKGWSEPDDFFKVSDDVELPYKRARLKKDDIILTIVGAGSGNVAIVPDWLDGANITQTTARLAINEELANSKFIFHLLESIVGVKNLNLFVKGAAQPGLNLFDVKKYHIILPPLHEQQKIAEILSTVDEQISTTQAIIDKSKELKKGLMQKLFSEGIGHTEFKDTKIGRIPKDWGVVKLNEVGLIKVGRDLNKEIYNPTLSKEHKVPVYSNAISYRGLYGFYSTSEYPKNSITITGRGDIGYAFARNEEFGAIGRLIVIQPNSNVDYVFLTNYINHCVNFHIETSGIPQLTGVQASAYKVAIPSLKEQQKIAEILSEADGKIEKEENEKAKLEELKKGLMQQLLTGQKRVKV
jgi:restriction endonuclease S subunit